MTKLQYRVLRNHKSVTFRAFPLPVKRFFATHGRGRAFDVRLGTDRPWTTSGFRPAEGDYSAMFAGALQYRISSMHRPKGYPKELDTE